MRIFLPASLALALGAPMGASADTRSDIQDLRQEIDAIRAAYEARLRALEERLKAAEGASSNTSNAAPAHPASPAAPAGVPGPSASPSAGSAGGANAFNPSMSLILSGLYTRTSQDPSRYAIANVMVPRRYYPAWQGNIFEQRAHSIA